MRQVHGRYPLTPPTQDPDFKFQRKSIFEPSKSIVPLFVCHKNDKSVLI